MYSASRREDRAAARRVLALLWLIAVGVVARQTRAGDDLSYTGLDNATVRVFAFNGVSAQRARAASRKAYVLGVPEAGHGTGLLVSKDGLILTARHVVDNARIVGVQFPGEDRAVAARVVYSDAAHDHAFLVVSGTHKNFVALPEKKPKLAVRQTVYVIGYPLDASRTRPQSQQGIVSGVLPDGSLQLGVALNPGNSGGPVVDAEEHLVGIAVARADPKAGAQGIGVAVPLEHILNGYGKALKSDELRSARKELAQNEKRLQAEAELVAALMTAEDSDDAWHALQGKKEAPATSRSVEDRLDAAFKAPGGPSADVLSIAAAVQWNAAAVSLERHESSRAYLARARDMAERAKGADSSIGGRSTFVAFAAEGHGPTDVDASLPAADDDDGEPEETGGGQSEPMDQLLRSLQTEKSIPVVRAGPTLALITPFQAIGIGAVGRFRFGNIVSLDARYQYGLHIRSSSGAGGSGSTGSHMFEALGGIVVGTWQSRNTTQLVVDVEHAAWATVYHYVPGDVPTVHTLVVEAGVLSGLVNLQTFGAGGIADAFYQQVFMLQGGIRYTYFYHANSDYLARAARKDVELSAHLIAPPFGVPEGSMNADGQEISKAPGFNVDVAWDTVLSLGQTEIGGGYFPAGDWIYVHLGWSYLFY